MRKSQMSIFFLKSFATGILTPVLALLLLAWRFAPAFGWSRQRVAGRRANSPFV